MIFIITGPSISYDWFPHNNMTGDISNNTSIILSPPRPPTHEPYHHHKVTKRMSLPIVIMMVHITWFGSDMSWRECTLYIHPYALAICKVYLVMRRKHKIRSNEIRYDVLKLMGRWGDDGENTLYSNDQLIYTVRSRTGQDRIGQGKKQSAVQPVRV